MKIAEKIRDRESSRGLYLGQNVKFLEEKMQYTLFQNVFFKA